MDEPHERLFEPTFNQSIKLRQAGPRVTSDAGAIGLREIDHRLGLTADLAAALIAPRDPDAIRYTQTELLRQNIYGLAPGYTHQDDADMLAHDVAKREGQILNFADRRSGEALSTCPTSDRFGHASAASAGHTTTLAGSRRSPASQTPTAMWPSTKSPSSSTAGATSPQAGRHTDRMSVPPMRLRRGGQVRPPGFRDSPWRPADHPLRLRQHAPGGHAGGRHLPAEVSAQAGRRQYGPGADEARLPFARLPAAARRSRPASKQVRPVRLPGETVWCPCSP